MNISIVTLVLTYQYFPSWQQTTFFREMLIGVRQSCFRGLCDVWPPPLCTALQCRRGQQGDDSLEWGRQPWYRRQPKHPWVATCKIEHTYQKYWFIEQTRGHHQFDDIIHLLFTCCDSWNHLVWCYTVCNAYFFTVPWNALRKLTHAFN